MQWGSLPPWLMRWGITLVWTTIVQAAVSLSPTMEAALWLLPQGENQRCYIISSLYTLVNDDRISIFVNCHFTNCHKSTWHNSQCSSGIRSLASSTPAIRKSWSTTWAPRGEVLVQPSQHQCHVRGPALWKRIPGGRRRVWLWGSGGQERVALLPRSRFLPRCYSDWSFTLTFSISVSFTTKECSSPCCNANNCTLKIGAECAHGVCCHECKVNPCQTHLTLSLYTLSCGAASGKL